MVYFDAQLFDPLTEDHSYALLTNVLHIKLVNPDSPSDQLYPRDANIKTLSIRFSLLYLPMREDFVKDALCQAFAYDDALHSITGTAREPSVIEYEVRGNEEDFLVCDFEAYFPLELYYFAIFLNRLN